LERWNAEIEKKCSEILGNNPERDMNWKTWTTEVPRRPFN
jgi:hypothetical protein